MPTPETAPYGTWRSPISADLLGVATTSLGQIALDGADIYWVEQRPVEGGRNVVVRFAADEQTVDVVPKPFNARTRVHEYGGGAFVVERGELYFSNYVDQRVYRYEPGETPVPITPATTPEGGLRYADGRIDPVRERMICVREDHTSGGEAVNTIVALDIDAEGPGVVLAEGYDFFASPRLSPDGTRLAWLAWNHPNMPWDGCELWVGEFGADGTLQNRRLIAGGAEESIFQPEWSPGGVLHFISDRSGWWNLYRLNADAVQPLAPLDAEFGQPQWLFGFSRYGFESEDRIICAVHQNGFDRLARLDTSKGELTWFALPYITIDNVHAAPGVAVFAGGLVDAPRTIVRLDLTTGRPYVIREAGSVDIEPGYISPAQSIEFPTEGGQMAHAFYYPPRNQDFAAPAGERPPLIVRSHGGPTSSASPALSLGVQYWTSRGFAFVDVNYGGSSGYGRAYRLRLNDNWGIVDVDDCANAARYLVAQGLADGDRVAIQGGSAGGYTTLCALTFRDYFKAGASYFGISDAEIMAKETHKFESRYLDGLIGPYPARRDIYVERSPLYFIDQVKAPMILFQGLEDKIVPPNQAEMMFEALRRNEMPVAYIAYEGEQHGFRKAENIKRTAEAELYFYGKVFGFAPSDTIEPVVIENMD